MNDFNNNHKTLALIDGKSVFYRGYYAMPNLTTTSGKPTGGVYGFATLAIFLVDQINPDYVIVAWDKPKTNIRRRKAIYDGYKANRKAAPADFYAQIPDLMNLLEALGWPLYELDDYEADDIMGTLSLQANQQAINTILISSDLDMLQIINDQTELYALKSGLANLVKITPQVFEQKYGIKQEQFLDYKSLKGDTSDNIPGVAGIGDKTAANLLNIFGSLDAIYDYIDDPRIKASVRKKLLDGKAQALMSRELAKIMCDAPIKLDLAKADVNNVNRDKLIEALKKLEFNSLIRKFDI